MVAGAANDALLDDLREAVDAAIADKHPYWHYRHSQLSAEPRAQHQAWDKMVLRHDDDFWKTHYPPNGWGCKCYVESLDEEEGKKQAEEDPRTLDMTRQTVEITRKGGGTRKVTTYPGIDPGFAYAPGGVAYDMATRDMTTLAGHVRRLENRPDRDVITAYTVRKKGDKNLLYDALNAVLRDGNMLFTAAIAAGRRRLGKEAPMPLAGTNAELLRDRLDAALSDLPTRGRRPPSGRPLRRRINIPPGTALDAFLSRYRQGRVITELSFTSTAIRVPIGHRKGKVEFVIQSHSAKSIKDLSAARREGEFLIGSGQRFEVEAVDSPNWRGLIRIHLTEMQ